MSNEQLKQTFEYCQRANEPEQWTFLAVAYYERGFWMNALYCFRMADQCRELMPALELAEAQG